MQKLMRSMKTFLTVVAVGVALFAATVTALADRLYLKDGRVLDGEVVRQDGDFVVFKVKGKSEAEFFELKDVQKVEKDAPAKVEAPKAETPKAETPKATGAASTPAAGKDEGKKEDKPKGKQLTGKPTKVAILHFGPPQDWKIQIDTTVGETICAQAWRDVIPMLEKDGTDVVVVQINSGGGALSEMARFWDAFREYKKHFRVVTWVESAISCAAMSPWVISEWYMKPEGNVGACTGWSGNLVAVKGPQLQMILMQMEDVSREAGRDPLIMRAMEIMNPLTANIDDDGNVTFFGDTSSGSVMVNRPGQILTLNSETAARIKFSKGTAATKEELVKVMGLEEVEWVGQKAGKYIDDFMIEAHKSAKYVGELAHRYRLALAAAQQLANSNDPRLGTELGKARQALNELRKKVELNDNLREILAPDFGTRMLDDAWFEAQEKLLRDLSLRAKEAEEQRRKDNRGR